MLDVNNFAANASNYNLISLGTANFYGSSDIQGDIAVLGTTNFYGAYAVDTTAAPDGSKNTSMYLASTITVAQNTAIQVDNGNFYTPVLTQSTWNASTHTLTGQVNNSIASNSGQTTAPNSSSLAPTDVGASSTFQYISSDLSKATSNGTISVDSSGNMVFSTSVTSGVAVFTLDASLLGCGSTYNGKTVDNIQINVPSGVDYVINVINLGCNQSLFSGMNFNAGTNDSQLLWNLEGSGTVTIDNGGNFYGSILAPNFTIDDDTTINGQVVAGSFNDYGVELHYTDFSSTVVPESGWFAAGATGLCFACVALARVRRQGLSC